MIELFHPQDFEFYGSKEIRAKTAETANQILNKRISEFNGAQLAEAQKEIAELKGALNGITAKIVEWTEDDCDCGYDTGSDTSHLPSPCYLHEIVEDIERVLTPDQKECE